MIKNNAWSIVEAKKARNIIKNKLVFKTKRNSNGEIQKYKVRLVAKGFNQKYGIDYFDKYSPVAKPSSLRAIIALAVQMKMTISHWDVITAYLNSNLNEEVYMKIPIKLKYFLEKTIRDKTKYDLHERAKEWLKEIKSRKNKVCHLNKAVYGLKQSGRQWYEKFNRKLKDIGVIPTRIDPCTYRGDRG